MLVNLFLTVCCFCILESRTCGQDSQTWEEDWCTLTRPTSHFDWCWNPVSGSGLFSLLQTCVHNNWKNTEKYLKSIKVVR